MKTELEEKYVCSERGKTFYWISKKENAPTLFFLPGLTADHTLFEKQIEFFADSYNIIVWDCPCHGKSRPYNGFSYSNVTCELYSILKAEGVTEAVFIGQSLGGMIAQYFIGSYPDMAKGLISVDSAPFGDYYSKSDFFWLSQLEWMCRLFPDKTLRKSMSKACGKTEYAQNKMMKMLSDYDKKELCHLMYIGEAAFIPENRNIDLPCPAVLILGDKDRVGKVAAYNKKWSERTHYPLFLIKGAAHNSNEDAPDEVNRIIGDFLKAGLPKT